MWSMRRLDQVQVEVSREAVNSSSVQYFREASENME
jgi:hypothetical protein